MIIFTFHRHFDNFFRKSRIRQVESLYDIIQYKRKKYRNEMQNYRYIAEQERWKSKNT